MKKIILLITTLCLIVCTILCGQAKPGIQIQAGLNLSRADFTDEFISSTFLGEESKKINLGYSFGLMGELPITRKQSLIVGIASTQVTTYPQIDYGLWYGLIIDKGEEQYYLNPAFLQRLRFDLVEIPVSWRYYFSTEGNFRPYFGLGMQTSFAWRERERWRAMFDTNESVILDDYVINEYEAKEKDFRHFRTAFTLNLGSALVINEKWDLMLDLQSNIISQRRSQESSVTSYIPVYWGDDLHWLGQTSLNIGLRRKL